MTLDSDGLGLEVSRVFAVERDELFRIVTDPDLIPRWFKPTPDTVITVLEYDLRVGGRFRFEYLQEDGTRSPVEGTFQEVSPPERLVHSWAWEPPDPEDEVDTRVTWSLSEHPDGTELVVRHQRFPDAGSAEGYHGGWKGVLERIGEFLSTDGEAG